jgi:hypothetical protein
MSAAVYTATAPAALSCAQANSSIFYHRLKMLFYLHLQRRGTNAVNVSG